jgi:hypothetical protein
MPTAPTAPTAPAPRLRLRVPRYALDLPIETLPDLAPASVEALVASLPAAGLATAGFDYGSAVCLRLPGYPRPLRPERATAFPIPGDVLLFEREHGVELVVFYERMGGTPAGAPSDAGGRKTGNRVGRVAGASAPAAREAARSLWKTGAAWAVAGQEGAPALASAADDREAAGAAVAARLDAWRRKTWRDHAGPPPAGGRSIALIVREYGVRTRVELAPEAAHTAEQIWQHLPLETTLMHGRYSGPEMFTTPGGAQWHWQPREEHRIAFPIPGDVVVYFGPAPRLQLNYFYGREAIPYGLPRVEVGNLVGASVGDFSAFAEACWRVGHEGWKTLVVERA